MIDSGRVMLNGVLVSRPGTLVSPYDVIALDGKPIAARRSARLWRYHKPAGLITTARDPQGRPTVFEKLPEDLPRVISIGRLDINTEGLLLLTNDGGLARHLEHPAQALARTYRVRAYGRANESSLARLGAGITLRGIKYQPIKITIERRRGDNYWLTMVLREGKNREIRRLLEFAGLQVNRLIRIGYGPFELGSLAPNEVAAVSPKELRRLLTDFFSSVDDYWAI